MYKYLSTLRPVSIGTAPKLNEAVEIVNFDKRMCVDGVGYAWGSVVYNEPLVNPSEWDLLYAGETDTIYYRDCPMQQTSAGWTAGGFRTIYATLEEAKAEVDRVYESAGIEN